MKYERFEQLPVWIAAIELATQIYRLTCEPGFERQRSLRDQIEPAAVSISNNIAEGFERGTNSDLLKFLYRARGSAGEVRSMLCLVGRLPDFSNLKFEISNLKLRSEEVSRQLRGWAQSLQESSNKGQRFLNAKSRGIDKARRDREPLLEELRRIQTGA